MKPCKPLEQVIQSKKQRFTERKRHNNKLKRFTGTKQPIELNPSNGVTQVIGMNQAATEKFIRAEKMMKPVIEMKPAIGLNQASTELIPSKGAKRVIGEKMKHTVELKPAIGIILEKATRAIEVNQAKGMCDTWWFALVGEFGARNCTGWQSG